jgi:pilus assembly protein CpaB
VVRVPLYAGQPITTMAIVHGASAGFMAAQLQPGMRAVSITISVDSGAGGFILPNDRIDLMLTTKGTENPPRVRVKTILSDVRVLAVDQTFKEDKDTKTVVGKTATLELTPEQAEMVAAAQNTGSLSLSLRGLGDNQVAATNTKRASSDDGPVSVIRYGVLRSNDSASTLQGEREKSQ